MKLRLLLLPSLLLIALAFVFPIYLMNITGQPAWLLLIPAILLILAYVLLRLVMWGASAGLREIIAGQSEPDIGRIARDITIRKIDAENTFDLEVEIDLSRPVNSVSDHFLSFALDTSQVVGGLWWDPKAEHSETSSGSVKAPVFDFSRAELDRLVGALSPAYLRIGGSEADKVFYDMESSGDLEIPPGFESLLTREQWDAANDFVIRNKLRMMFTLNAGPGTRTYRGDWLPDNAIDLLKYTQTAGYAIDVWELGNEMNVFFSVHGVGEHVPTGQYSKDARLARLMIDKYAPNSRFAGQGSCVWPILGEPLNFFFGYLPEYLQLTGELLDLVTWHYYPQQSRRGWFAVRRAYPYRMLDPKNLDDVVYWGEKVTEFRDLFAADKPIWLGETGNAQFGGEPGVSDAYIGGLWWLDQLGLLARMGHEVVVRQTLTGSNYGLLDETDLSPRPDYWNSLLWKRLMGQQVYDIRANGTNVENVRLYAHAQAGKNKDSVTVLLINLDPIRGATFSFPQYCGEEFTIFQFQTADVLGGEVILNGEILALDQQGRLPVIPGKVEMLGEDTKIIAPPLSYSFLCSSRRDWGD